MCVNTQLAEIELNWINALYKKKNKKTYSCVLWLIFFIGVRQIGLRIPNEWQVSNSALMKIVGVVLTIPHWFCKSIVLVSQTFFEWILLARTLRRRRRRRMLSEGKHRLLLDSFLPEYWNWTLSNYNWLPSWLMQCVWTLTEDLVSNDSRHSVTVDWICHVYYYSRLLAKQVLTMDLICWLVLLNSFGLCQQGGCWRLFLILFDDRKSLW